MRELLPLTAASCGKSCAFVPAGASDPDGASDPEGSLAPEGFEIPTSTSSSTPVTAAAALRFLCLVFMFFLCVLLRASMLLSPFLITYGV